MVDPALRFELLYATGPTFIVSLIDLAANLNFRLSHPSTLEGRNTSAHRSVGHFSVKTPSLDPVIDDHPIIHKDS